jgi:hypothetical protein
MDMVKYKTCKAARDVTWIFLIIGKKALMSMPSTQGLTPEQQIQALEAALANQNVTLLFQGGIVGLALGGTTAWFVAQNIRARRREEDEHGEDKYW